MLWGVGMAFEDVAHDSRLAVCQVIQRNHERRFDQLDGAVDRLHGEVDVIGEKVDVMAPKMENFEQWQKRQNGALVDISKEVKDTQKEIKALRSDLTKIIALAGSVVGFLTVLADRLIK